MKKGSLIFPIIIFVLSACSSTVQTSLPTDTLQPTVTSIATEAPASSLSEKYFPGFVYVLSGAKFELKDTF